MKIIFFAHPNFLGHQSMPRFANMLAQGMAVRGHEVEIWQPSPFFAGMVRNVSLQKYLGYIDQLILFPFQAKEKIKRHKGKVLYVLTDHALGPWMQVLARKLHVIHCHDFIAQQAAMDLIRGFQVNRAGKYYQSLIRKGFVKGVNFISVSKKTQRDLHQFLPAPPNFSGVVYNGFNQEFTSYSNIEIIRNELSKHTQINLNNGFILHIGGNQWYKNRKGVIEIYEFWRKKSRSRLPLLLIGNPPSDELISQKFKSAFSRDIHFLANKDDAFVRKAYASGTLLLFPSLAEGFGWPIAEAMASGCPVITTKEEPMTEVAEDAAFYIPRRPVEEGEMEKWLEESAETVERIVCLKEQEREVVVEKGFKNAKRFENKKALDDIEGIYKKIIAEKK